MTSKTWNAGCVSKNVELQNAFKLKLYQFKIGCYKYKLLYVRWTRDIGLTDLREEHKTIQQERQTTFLKMQNYLNWLKNNKVGSSKQTGRIIVVDSPKKKKIQIKDFPMVKKILQAVPTLYFSVLKYSKVWQSQS